MPAWQQQTLGFEVKNCAIFTKVVTILLKEGSEKSISTVVIKEAQSIAYLDMYLASRVLQLAKNTKIM